MQQLDYAICISCEPFYIPNVGHMKTPTLREIDKLTFQKYNIYTYHLRMTPQDYFESYHPKKQIADDTIINMTKYDVWLADDTVRQIISDALNFFFVNKFQYMEQYNAFVSTHTDDNGQMIADGIINKDNFAFVINILLQRLHISQDENEVDDISKATNKRGISIYKKMMKARRKFKRAKAHNPNLSLPNIIASVCAWSHNVNWINVWDMTIFQIWDLYERLRSNDVYDIQRIQVAAYGDKENKFKLCEWSANIYEKNE